MCGFSLSPTLDLSTQISFDRDIFMCCNLIQTKTAQSLVRAVFIFTQEIPYILPSLAGLQSLHRVLCANNSYTAARPTTT